MVDLIHQSELDMASERLRVAQQRETAESSDSPSKPEDYIVLCEKYRAVSFFFKFSFLKASLETQWERQNRDA